MRNKCSLTSCSSSKFRNCKMSDNFLCGGDSILGTQGLESLIKMKAPLYDLLQ